MNYKINREIDGHPIEWNGTPLTKKEILTELNKMEDVIKSLLERQEQFVNFTKSAGDLVTTYRENFISLSKKFETEIK